MLPMWGFRRKRLTPEQIVRLGRTPDTKGRSFIENVLGVPVHKMRDFTAFSETGSKRVWATFRACHLTASVILSTPFTIQLKGREGNGAEEVEDVDLTEIMENPNPWDSWEELLYQWVFHMKLTGNAYWLKDEMNAIGQPKALWPLLPQHVQIIPDRTNKIAGYVYRVGGEEIYLDVDEVIHFRRPHPTNLLLGMGDIEPSQDLYCEFVNRNTYTEKFMEHGAMPSGVLTKKEAVEDEEEWGKLKAHFETNYAGKKNAGKTVFLNGDWAYHKLGLTHEEMQSLEKEKWSVEQIFINHGVPLSIAGIQGAANYATARQDEINFRKYEVVPLLDILLGKLNGMSPPKVGGGVARGQFVRAYNTNYQLVYQLSGLIDVEQVTRDYTPLVDRGAMTLNELREKAGLTPVEDVYLDQFWVKTSTIPIEMAGLSVTATPIEENLLPTPPNPENAEGDNGSEEDSV